MRRPWLTDVAACVVIAATLRPVLGQYFQEGQSLAPSNVILSISGQPNSSALSADGSTAVLGYSSDNGYVGAVWVFTHSSSGWSQQGGKLAPNDAQQWTFFGTSVALSSDGHTMLAGGPGPNNSGVGAWVFTRTDGTWSQQSELVGDDTVPNNLQFGYSVALSADGNTALVGGPSDSGGVGATWVFTRSGSVWTQQGDKLVGSGGSGGQGSSVALSADGNTALIGGPWDDSHVGAAWIFGRSGSVWTQQGNKLVGTDSIGMAYQGGSVALSGDGGTALVGGYWDNNFVGAAWVFVLSGGVWSQQGGKLVGNDDTGESLQGAVSLSFDGNTALVGGDGANNNAGAVWVYTRSNGIWTQEGSKLAASGSTPNALGQSVALSQTGDTAIALGSPQGYPALWVFAAPRLSVFTPASADPGTPFNITVMAQDSAGATVTGYTDAVHFTSTDGAATLPADSTLTNGSAQVPVTLFTPGNQTITATDTVYSTITGTSGPVSTYIVGPAPGSTLSGSLADFSWNAVSGATEYQLSVGTTAGGTDIFAGTTAGTSQSVGSIPCTDTGATIYVQLAAEVNGSFQTPTDYTYNCVLGLIDFNHDGHPDVIWEEPTIGWAQIWYLGGPEGVSISNAANLTKANPWHIVGVADFNGDGNPDVVWQDPVSGAVQVWFLGGPLGNQLVGALNITAKNPWRVVSVADFNQDGHPDLLWQDTNGSAQIWYLGGPQGITLLGAADLDQTNPWRIVGTGDFNGDGVPDVLWQDPVSGVVQIWYMGGTTPGAQGSAFQSAVNLTGAMTTKVVAIADFNRDGHPDVVFQDSATGAATVYYYTGGQGITPNGTAVLSAGNPWHIAGPH